MRILIATPLYPPESGGPATDAALLYRELTARGIATDVIPFSSVKHLPSGVRHLRYALKILHAARGADAVVAMDTFSVCVPAAFATMLARTPLVVRVPGDFAWEQAVQRFGVTDSIEAFQTKRYGWHVETIRTFQRWAVRRAALVAVPSDFFGGIVTTWGLEPARITRIYLGIDLSETASPPENVPAGKILFSVGRLVPWKGFGALIALMPQLPEAWHLVIVGDGPQREALEAQARRAGLEKKVTFLGALPHAHVLGWLARADAFVQNTSFESFSFQIAEAMACGARIIATRAGSIPELITDGVEGVLCAPDDQAALAQAILSTQTDGDAWNARSIAATQRAQEFSIEKSVDSFVKALTSVCA